MCHYEYGVWNVYQRKTVIRIQVEKLRTQLTTEEIGPMGCTPCLEDQSMIQLSNGLSLQLCRNIAAPVQHALEQSLSQGAIIKSVQGYRASMSRGEIDSKGNRTLLSNHAFGTAIDINRANNGLYDQCFTMGPTCRLIQGGAWNPQNPLSLTPQSPIVKAFQEIGLKWGGEIQGKQKDMMHFSPTGY